MRYAIIGNVTKTVLNVCEWDGLTAWTPPPGTFALQIDKCEIGDTWDGTKIIHTPQPTTSTTTSKPISLADLEQRITALENP